MTTALTLPLKKIWWDMTDTHSKSEDYREINSYWLSRLVFQHEKVFRYLTGVDWHDCTKPLKDAYVSRIIEDSNKRGMLAFKPFITNAMTLGYPKSTDGKKVKIFEHNGIVIRIGESKWGAEPGKMYFVIKHGKRLQ